MSRLHPLPEKSTDFLHVSTVLCSKRSKLYYNKDTFLFIEGATGKNEIGVYLRVCGNLGIDRFKWQEI